MVDAGEREKIACFGFLCSSEMFLILAVGLTLSGSLSEDSAYCNECFLPNPIRPLLKTTQSKRNPETRP